VIRVSATANLRPAVFGDSADLVPGDIVLAIGNPLGLSSSVTEGIVSAVGRVVTEPGTQGSPGATLHDVIQTSAAINPGNSGGALATVDGVIVGIPTLAATRQAAGGAAPGIGFAIPSDTVVAIARQLVRAGHVTSP
jgi:S1-C subfamily serine protease